LFLLVEIYLLSTSINFKGALLEVDEDHSAGINSLSVWCSFMACSEWYKS